MSYQKIATVGNASRETHLGKTPKLKSGGDDKRAAELEQYIDEAEGGLRAILKAGFFLECLADDLPQGELGPWVEAHCKRKWRTVQRWKQIATGVGEAVGIKYEKRIALKLHEVLSLPMGKLSDDLKPVREKIENEIAGKSYRQLFLELKQSKDGENPDRGRRPGEGGRPAELKGTIEEVAAARKKASRRHCFKAGDELEKVGIDFIAMDDGEITACVAAYDRTAKCMNAWLAMPAANRDAKQIQKLWKTL